MRRRVQSDLAIAHAIGARIQALRLKKNISLEAVGQNAGISRQTLHLLISPGEGTLINLIAVLRRLASSSALVHCWKTCGPAPFKSCVWKEKSVNARPGDAVFPTKPKPKLPAQAKAKIAIGDTGITHARRRSQIERHAWHPSAFGYTEQKRDRYKMASFWRG